MPTLQPPPPVSFSWLQCDTVPDCVQQDGTCACTDCGPNRQPANGGASCQVCTCLADFHTPVRLQPMPPGHAPLLGCSARLFSTVPYKTAQLATVKTVVLPASLQMAQGRAR